MNLRINHLLSVGIIFACPILLEFPKTNTAPAFATDYSVDKELRSLFSKMIYIDRDSFTMGQVSSPEFKMTASDSTLLSPGIMKKTAVDPFYISATEVTNGDWKEFYQEKILELGQASAKKQFFPDTSLWVKEFPYSYNAPMAEYYFSHPRFNDFPVVGVTWDQANAFCIWKTKKLKRLLGKKGIQSTASFRLPSELEWEGAAKNRENESKRANRHVYVWPTDKSVLQINRLSNVGQIRNTNNVLLKDYADDGCLYTCQVASYPPNYRGIYDLAGNVSEWTSDPGYTYAYDPKNPSVRKLTSLPEVEGQIQELSGRIDPADPLLSLYIKWLEHDQNILRTDDTKICKGGSWANGIIYTQIGNRQGVKKGDASTKIGFRIAISNVNPSLSKYFPKKSWAP